MDLDPERRALAAERAADLREWAAEHQQQSAALLARARVIERTWNIEPPAETLDARRRRP